MIEQKAEPDGIAGRPGEANVEPGLVLAPGRSERNDAGIEHLGTERSGAREAEHHHHAAGGRRQGGQQEFEADVRAMAQRDARADHEEPDEQEARAAFTKNMEKSNT